MSDLNKPTGSSGDDPVAAADEVDLVRRWARTVERWADPDTTSIILIAGHQQISGEELDATLKELKRRSSEESRPDAWRG